MNARTWLQRNAIGFLLIIVAVALIFVTITWPARTEELGFRNPVQTVSLGATGDIEGARLTMKRVEPDLSDQTGLVKLEEQDGSRPDDGKVVAYAFTVQPPTTPPDELTTCNAAATDGTRRWLAGNLSSVRSWVVGQGYASYCNLDKSFALTYVVPKDADITAIDLLINPAPEGDAVAAASHGYVVRFSTG